MSELEKISAGVVQALSMLTDNPKDHKQAIGVLNKLTKKREYVEVSGRIWLEHQGPQKTIRFLNDCPLEEPRSYPLLEKHLKLLVNVMRVEKFIEPLVELELVEALRTVLDCPSDKIRSAVLKIIGLLSVSDAARRQILEGNLIPEMMNVVTGSDETFLLSVLPRLLRDEKLANCFCQYGGIGYLQKTMTMGSTGQGVTGAIVGISLLSQFPKLVKLMVEEEEFVTSLVMMLSYSGGEGVDLNKVKVVMLKAIFNIAGNADGLKQLQESGPLPLMEMIEHADTEQLAAVVAAFDVLNVLCADAAMREEVDRLGASDFVTLLFFFAGSSTQAVLEPLCRLLRALAQGDHRIQIIEGLKQELSKRPQVAVFQETLDAITQNRLAKASTIATTAIEADEATQRLPQRRLTKDSQTMRQGAKRVQVIKEVVTTEHTYVQALESMVRAFLRPMEASVGSRAGLLASAPLVTAKDVEVIFGNVAQILDLHKGLLRKLETLTRTNPSATISGWFSDMADRLVDVYKPYFRSYRESLVLLTKKMQSKAFAKYLVKLGKDSKEALRLESLLIMPIQRLPRYALLIKELERVTIDTHPEKPILVTVTKKVEGKIALLNDVTSLPPSAEEQQQSMPRISAALGLGPSRSSTAAASPVLRDGTLREFREDSADPVTRKALLMRDKLLIMANTKGAAATVSRGSSANVVYSFDLKQLRVDMLEDSFELVDMRDDVHSGPEFDHEDPEQMREWVNTILDAIYDARHQT